MINYDVKMKLDRSISVNERLMKARDFNSSNIAFYGKNDEIEPFINDYFKDKDIKFITIDVSKVESKDFYFNEMKDIVDEGTPFVLYLKNYGIADRRLRYIWSSIYKDHCYTFKNGFVYNDEIKVITTIIIIDETDKEYKELDLSEKHVLLILNNL